MGHCRPWIIFEKRGISLRQRQLDAFDLAARVDHHLTGSRPGVGVPQGGRGEAPRYIGILVRIVADLQPILPRRQLRQYEPTIRGDARLGPEGRVRERYDPEVSGPARGDVLDPSANGAPPTQAMSRILSAPSMIGIGPTWVGGCPGSSTTTYQLLDADGTSRV